MARRIVDVDAPDRFVAGEDEVIAAEDSADGLDDRFYLEVMRRRRRMSVTLAREQLALLASGVRRIVDELEHRGLVAIDIEPLEPEPPKRPRRHAFRAETLLLEDVVMEEELLLDDYAEVELVEDEPTGGEIVLTPDALILPTTAELGISAEAEADDDAVDEDAIRDRDMTPPPAAPPVAASKETNASNYVVGPHARVYQPPPRKKPRPKKRRSARVMCGWSAYPAR